jgi:two-component sensor histidine kinase
MQIISSLLNLQKQYVDDKEAVNVLMESQNRVKSMAMIHEKLYKSEDLVHIEISEYIESLLMDYFIHMQ